MKTCPRCGAQMPVTQQICNNCFYNFANEEPDNPQSTSANNNLNEYDDYDENYDEAYETEEYEPQSFIDWFTMSLKHPTQSQNTRMRYGIITFPILMILTFITILAGFHAIALDIFKNPLISTVVNTINQQSPNNSLILDGLIATIGSILAITVIIIMSLTTFINWILRICSYQDDIYHHYINRLMQILNINLILILIALFAIVIGHGTIGWTFLSLALSIGTIGSYYSLLSSDHIVHRKPLDAIYTLLIGLFLLNGIYIGSAYIVTNMVTNQVSQTSNSIQNNSNQSQNLPNTGTTDSNNSDTSSD